MSLRQREPRALQVPFVFPPLRLCFGESNLLLTETSARIKVSPIARVMLLKGLACILEAGSGSTLGCHMCRPGMRQNGWGSQNVLPPPLSSVYCCSTLSWLTSAGPGCLFVLNNYFTKMVQVIHFRLLLFCSASGWQWWWWFPSLLFTM